MKRSSKLLGVSFTGLFIALLGLFCSTLITKSNVGFLYRIQEALQCFFIFSAWAIFYQIIKISVLCKYKELYNKEIPYIFFSITRFLIIICAVLSAVVFVFHASIFSFMALSGLVSAGLTFALGGLIFDAFSGIIMEIEGPFEVGDWIKLSDGIVGKITKINWRTVVLESPDQCAINVTHGSLAKGFTNYSRPEKAHWDHIEIPLDHSIPVDRAERILRAGALSTPTIYNKACRVWAHKATENGIEYSIYYMIPEQALSKKIKHEVIESVTRHLHNYGLGVVTIPEKAQSSFENQAFQEQFPLMPESIIRKVDFLKDFPQETIDDLCKGAMRHIYHEDENIVREGDKGQSLFLIGEGIVNISIQYVNNLGEQKEKDLFTLTYPEYFGEMALLLGEKRSATVKSLGNTLVYEISQELLKETLKDRPEIFEALVFGAKEKKKKNEQTRVEMEKMKVHEEKASKGLFANLKNFFK